MAVALAFVVLLAVVFVVGAPLRREPKLRPVREREARIADLLSAREFKYREIRDTKLDFDTGKLSEEDYVALDATLRGDAFGILEQLEALTDSPSGPGVLEQQDGVQEEQDGEHDGPAVEVSFDERSASEGAGAGAHAERP